MPLLHLRILREVDFGLCARMLFSAFIHHYVLGRHEGLGSEFEDLLGGIVVLASFILFGRSLPQGALALLCCQVLSARFANDLLHLLKVILVETNGI
jgi:hypothetical protein